VEGRVTERPLYASQEERGQAVASWLGELALRSTNIALRLPDDRFSYIDFLLGLEKKLRLHDATVHARVETAFRYLDTALKARLEEIPTAFAHGDLHALNIVWGASGNINAVIDWEFCGMRPQGYDAALFMGCIAMEDPALIGDACAVRLMHDLRAACVYAPATFAAMPALIIAGRLAWLSDWLHRGIDDMVDAECTLINILLNNLPVLDEICKG
jgi:homoserine kinase type II